MDSDLNKYDAHHRVTHHAKMSDQEWEEVQQGIFTLLQEAREDPPLLQRTALEQIVRLLQGFYIRLTEYFAERAMNAAALK